MRPCLVLVPFRGRNAYINNTNRMLSKYYDVISWEYLEKHPLLFFRLKGIYLNWIENTITPLQKAKLILMRLCGKKVVWVFHNSMPHEHQDRAKSTKNYIFMAHISSHILIHSRNSLPVIKKLLSPHQKTPITYVEHVNYIGCYPEQNGEAPRDRLGIKKDQFVFLFTGSIRPYKNIEIMIRAFRKAALPNAVLLIAGYACDKAYADSLTTMIGSDPTIRFEEGIIPDDSMCAYLSAANVMVLSHSKISVLNSGMMIMAFSYALPVITTDIAMAQDFPSDILWKYT